MAAMAGRAVALVAAVVALSAPLLPLVAVDGQKCTGGQKLVLKPTGGFNTTLYAGLPEYSDNATCADGTAGGFYYSDSVNGDLDADFIVWLGDSPLCAGSDCDELCDGIGAGESDLGDVCADVGDQSLLGDVQNIDEVTEAKARCLYSRVICSSQWWGEFDEITPQTFLCQDDPEFGKYKRVFLPSCTLDWWLGNGNNAPGPLDASEAFRFRGHQLLTNMVMELAFNYNLTASSRIILGGTRGGGVAALNLVGEIRDLLAAVHPLTDQGALPNVRALETVADSAWFFNAEQFTPTSDDPELVFSLERELIDTSADWLDTAALNSDCAARWNTSTPSRLHRCLFSGTLIDSLPAERILFVQSAYDLVQLQSLNLLNDSAVEEYIDSAGYGSAAIQYIETFGQTVREDMELSAAVSGNADEHYFFVTSCAQHGYVAPTSIHVIDARTESISDFGSVTFQRDFEVFNNVELRGLTVRDTFAAFASGSATPLSLATDAANGVVVLNNIRADDCGRFLCNEACTTTVVPFTVGTQFGVCEQYMVVAYGVSVLLIFYVGFLLSYREVRRFRTDVHNYWARIAIVEQGMDVSEGIKEVQQQLLNEAASSEYRKIHLMVKNLSYWAPARNRRSKPYRILSNVDLTFAPGSVHAVMGPSGSGKSTMLDILALKRDSGKIAGTHFINGVASHSGACDFLREWLVHNSSYVRQTDVLFPLLTVREHLSHAAWLMLPQYMDAESKLRRVWQVIRLLELDGCADTICGDGGVTVEGGISGGQRRRVSVATQLLKLPALLLLDEPTSGLDSTNALLLVKSLHVMAHEAGVNVIMTIHQPRREIFEFFDSLSFLVSGRVVFSGLADEAAGHFQLPPGSTNVANDILDLLQTCSQDTVKSFENKYADGPLGDAVLEEMEAEITVATPQLLSNLQEVLVENSLAEGRWSWAESSSAASLSWVHMSRSLRRGGFQIGLTSLLSAVGGGVVGYVFYDVDSYASRTALAYLTVATMTFLQGTFLGDRYLGEKQNYDHEASSGTFRNWTAFLISQFLRDCVSSSIEGVAFAVPVYWLGGFNPELERFALYMLIMVLTSFVVLCQNVLIEIDRDDLRVAAMLQIGLLGLGALFNGFIIRIDDIPGYLQWVPFVMVTYWSFVATLINDFGNFSIDCDISVLECAARTGDAVIRALSFDDRDVYVCLVVLVAFVFVFRGLAVLDFYVRYVRNRGNTLKRVAADEDDDFSRQGSFKKTPSSQGLGLGLGSPSPLPSSSFARSDSSASGAPPGLGMGSPDSNSMAGSVAGSVDGRSRRGSGATAATAATGGKNTMNAMLEAKTPTMLRQESGLGKAETKNAAASPRTPRYDPNAPAVPNRPSAQVIQASNFVLQPSTKKKDKKKRDLEALPEVEMAYYDKGEDVPLSFLQAQWKEVLLSRNLFFMIFLVDFFSSAYICRFDASEGGTIEIDEEAETGVTGLLVISVFILAIYIFFFAAQVMLLVPTTLDGKLDCTWYGFGDAMSGFLLLVDMALTLQATGASSDFEIQLILAMVVRVLRFMRMYYYWNKVDAFHYVRARSFLEMREDMIEEAAEYNVDSQASRRISGFGEDGAGTGSGRLPSRPSRPGRAGQDSGSARIPAALRMQTTSIGRQSGRISATGHGSTSGHSSGRPSRPARPARPARPTRPGRPAARPVGRVSARFGRISARLTAADVPVASTASAASEEGESGELGPMWRPTGNNFFYNPYTGQMLSMAQLAARRAAPPLPPNPSQNYESDAA